MSAPAGRVRFRKKESPPAGTGGAIKNNHSHTQYSMLESEVKACSLRGWKCITLDGKIPTRQNWTTFNTPEDALLRHVARGGNIGLRTGQASGVDVLDIDDSLFQHDLITRLPQTVVVTTPRGLHHYFRHHDGVVNRAGVGDDNVIPFDEHGKSHVDVRGCGGQVVMAGSVNPVTKRKYEYLEGHSPDDVDVAEWPEWLLDIVLKPEAPSRPLLPAVECSTTTDYGAAALEAECSIVSSTTEGKRNHQLNVSACKMGALVAGGEITEQDAEAGLLEAARQCGLPDDESRKTIDSGLSAGKQHPRKPVEGRTDHRAVSTGPEALKAPDAPQQVQNDHPALVCEGLPPGWRDMKLPRRQFALGEAFPLGSVSCLVAAGGGGKSMIALAAAASVCIGRTLLFDDWEPAEPGRALYISFEDDKTEIIRRLQRIAYAHNLTGSESFMLGENLSIVSMPTSPFFRVGAGQTVEPGQGLLELSKILRGGTDGESPRWHRMRGEQRPPARNAPYRLCIIDPKSSLLAGAVDENANAVAQRCVNLLNAMAGEETALLLVDHVAKMDRELASSGRGAGAWGDASRQVWGLRPLSEKEERQVPSAVQHRQFAAIEQRKSNYTGFAPTRYLMRDMTPEGAGVMRVYDWEAEATMVAREETRTIQRAVLAMVAMAPTTRSELTGKSSGREARERGLKARNMIADRCGDAKVSVRRLADVLQSMLSTGALVEVSDPDGKLVLRGGTDTTDTPRTNGLSAPGEDGEVRTLHDPPPFRGGQSVRAPHADAHTANGKKKINELSAPLSALAGDDNNSPMMGRLELDT